MSQLLTLSISQLSVITLVSKLTVKMLAVYYVFHLSNLDNSNESLDVESYSDPQTIQMNARIPLTILYQRCCVQTLFIFIHCLAKLKSVFASYLNFLTIFWISTSECLVTYCSHTYLDVYQTSSFLLTSYFREYNRRVCLFLICSDEDLNFKTSAVYTHDDNRSCFIL